MGGSPSKDHITMAGRDPNGPGRVAIVTGPTGVGIGFETSRWLAESGYHVILAGRSQERLDKCKNDIINVIASKVRRDENSPPIQLTPLVCDLGSLASIESFVTEFEKLNLPLHLLINNAGVLSAAYTHTVDGFETTFGTNHVGHFHLTNLLLPKLKQSAPSRIVNVASRSHRLAPTVTTETIRQVAFHPTEAQYGNWKTYGMSKLANILHAKELNKRYAEEGVTAYSLHPGVVSGTDLAKSGAAKFVWKAMAWAMKTPEIGAGTSIFCATSPDALKDAGCYFDVCTPITATPAAQNSKLAQALWTITEDEIAFWRMKKNGASSSSSSSSSSITKAEQREDQLSS